jgi:hypothetical protein
MVDRSPWMASLGQLERALFDPLDPEAPAPRAPDTPTRRIVIVS